MSNDKKTVQPMPDVEPVLDDIINRLRFSTYNIDDENSNDNQRKIEHLSLDTIANSFRYEPLKINISASSTDPETNYEEADKSGKNAWEEKLPPILGNPFTQQNTTFGFLNPEFSDPLSKKKLIINSKMKLLFYFILRNMVGTKKIVSIGKYINKPLTPEDEYAQGASGQVSATYGEYVWEEIKIKSDDSQYFIGLDPDATDIQTGKNLLAKVKEVNPLFHQLIENHLKTLMCERYYKVDPPQRTTRQEKAMEDLYRIIGKNGSESLIDRTRDPKPKADLIKDEKETLEKLITLEQDAAKHGIELWPAEDSPQKFKQSLAAAESGKPMVSDEIYRDLYAITGSQYQLQILSFAKINANEFASTAAFETALKISLQHVPLILCRIPVDDDSDHDMLYLHINQNSTQTLIKLKDYRLDTSTDFILASPLDNVGIFKILQGVHRANSLFDLITEDCIANLETAANTLAKLKDWSELEKTSNLTWPEKHSPSKLHEELKKHLLAEIPRQFNNLNSAADAAIKADAANVTQKTNSADHFRDVSQSFEKCKTTVQTLITFIAQIKKWSNIHKLIANQIPSFETLSKELDDELCSNSERKPIYDFETIDALKKNLLDNPNITDVDRKQAIKKILLENTEKNKQLENLLQTDPKYQLLKDQVTREFQLEQQLSSECFLGRLHGWKDQLSDMGIEEYYLSKNIGFLDNYPSLDGDTKAKVKILHQKHQTFKEISDSLSNPLTKDFTQLVTARQRCFKTLSDPETKKLMETETDMAAKIALYAGLLLVTGVLLGAVILAVHSKKTIGTYNFFKAFSTTSSTAAAEKATKIMGAKEELAAKHEKPKEGSPNLRLIKAEGIQLKSR